MKFIAELKRRNAWLFWYGAVNFFAALLCAVFLALTDTKVLGINAWIKPMKFFVSIGIFTWTMNWFLHYLNRPRKERSFTWMVIIVFTFETVYITWQAANGRLSHFNISTLLYDVMFALMGLAITVLTVWTGYIGYLFFKRNDLALPPAYLWGIRLGILVFVLFAFEGFAMAGRLSHTVGGPDGGNGLALVNWSREHGDLRIAHFLGMHTLQIFPLFGYFVAKKVRTVILFAACYFIAAVAVLVQALMGIPLLR